MLCAALLWLLVYPISSQAQIFSRTFPAKPRNAANDTPLDKAKNEVARLLRSTSKKDQAWAAYLSGTHRLEKNVPVLVEMMNKSVQGGETDDETQYVMRAALDALIQLGADVQASELQTLYARFPDEVVILLSNSTENVHATLLALLAETPTNRIRWLALGNLLAQSRAPGFAAFLLREMKISVAIAVFSPERELGGGWGGGDGGGGRGFCAPPEGFPVVASYTLTDYAARGAVVVADGPHTIFYTRHFNLCSGEDDSLSLRGSPDRYRLEFLLAMLGITPDESKFDVNPYFEIIWQDARQYAREVRRIRREVRQSYRDLLRQLQESKLLLPTEAEALTPNISYEISDQRNGSPPPLPEVPDDSPNTDEQLR
jgi:hypothetical protein